MQRNCANQAAIEAKAGPMVAALARLLGSAAVSVQEAAAAALFKWVALDRVCQAITAQPGCVAALAQLLSSTNACAQQCCLTTLHGLVHRTAGDCWAVVAAVPGCIPAVVKVVVSGSSVSLKVEAAEVLRKLAASSGAAIAAQPGSIRGLVQLLSSDRAQGQAVAAEALWRMHATVLPNRQPSSKRQVACRHWCSC